MPTRHLESAGRSISNNSKHALNQGIDFTRNVGDNIGRTGKKVGEGVMDVTGTGFEQVKGLGRDAASATQSALRKVGLNIGGRRSRRRSKSRKSRHNRRRTRHSRRRRSSSRRRRSHTRRRR